MSANPLTFEEASRLRQVATESMIRDLSVHVLSGASEIAENVTGTKVFTAILRGQMWSARKRWVWKYLREASTLDQKRLKDISGIADGDDVTVGQLEFILGERIS